MTLFASALVAVAAAFSPAEPPPLPVEDALRRFRQLCVASLPNPQRFAETIEGSGLRWRKVEKTPAEEFGAGLSWESGIGRITYHDPPYSDITGGGPACHLQFHTDAGYSHADLAARLVGQLGLPAGRDRSGKRDKQTQWETDFADGMHVRLFLTSDFDWSGGKAARLSISRRLEHPPGDRRRRKAKRRPASEAAE